jgi:hypothetical protein
MDEDQRQEDLATCQEIIDTSDNDDLAALAEVVRRLLET